MSDAVETWVRIPASPLAVQGFEALAPGVMTGMGGWTAARLDCYTVIMAELVLGAKREKLTLIYTVNDAWSTEMTLKQDGTPIAWPSAPVLEFPDVDIDWTATLSSGDTVASWNKTEAEVTAVHDAAGGDGTAVRLSVDGQTWWKGLTSPDA